MELLKDRVTMITGASRGLGKAFALRFAGEGSTVVLAGRSYDAMNDICREITESGGEGSAVRMNVQDPESIRCAVDVAVERYGRIDVLVNNAGISMVNPSESLSYEDWNNAIGTNLTGVFFCCQAVARHMIDRGAGGCIINISSTFGKTPVPRRAAYCASKAGTDMITRVLAAEWAEKNIRVNAIAPGYLNTEFIQDLKLQGKLDTEALNRRIPQGRMGNVEEITGLALYMAGDEATYMTGSVVYIDGGWTAYGFV